MNHYYNATLPGFSVFAITAERKPLDERIEKKPVEKPTEKNENATGPVEEKPKISVPEIKLEKTPTETNYTKVISGTFLIVISGYILLTLRQRKKHSHIKKD